MAEQYDLIIIGGGPAGLAAGIYAGRAKLKTLILEKEQIGGKIYTTREIVNYPSIEKTSGPELMKQMENHAKKFGAEIREENVKEISILDEVKLVKTRKNEYTAKAVIIATGSKPRKLNIPGEEEFVGMGVAYCATCDAEFFEGQEVVVIGSGDQAIEEGLYIARFASKATVVVIHEEGILDCNKIAREKAFKEPKMHFIWNSTVSGIYGEENVKGVYIKNLKNGEILNYPCQGVFIFCGMVPATDFLNGQIELNERGWIKTDGIMGTSVGGIFAAGDVREKYLRQVATAVSDGAIAATAAEQYITELKDFKERVEKTEKQVYIGFWNPEISGSLDVLNEKRMKLEMDHTFIEIDISRKKVLAQKYHILLSNENKAEIIQV